MPPALPTAENEGIFLLLPQQGVGGDLLTVLKAWHRARGGVTLLVDKAHWTGVAAVDRSLVAGTIRQDEWTLRDLHALARPRAVTMRTADPPGIIFLDRDGTIIEDQDYLSDPEGVTLLPGAADGLRALSEGGAALVVVSNQSGVGSGRFTLDQLGGVNARMQKLLADQGVSLDAIYCCIHAADAGCDCRKPATGLARAASARFDISLENSVVVGDKASDLAMARALGVPGFLVTTGYGVATLRERAVPADYVIDDLTQLARICGHPAGLPVEVELPTV